MGVLKQLLSYQQSFNSLSSWLQDGKPAHRPPGRRGWCGAARCRQAGRLRQVRMLLNRARAILLDELFRIMDSGAVSLAELCLEYGLEEGSILPRIGDDVQGHLSHDLSQ